MMMDDLALKEHDVTLDDLQDMQVVLLSLLYYQVDQFVCCDQTCVLPLNSLSAG